MNRLRFISQVLYRLKRRYGEAVIIYNRLSSTTNLETGVKSVITESVIVKRAIVLPSKIHREFVYDLTFIATNKNFTYGGHFDTTERQLIFDRKDLPNFEIKVGMYLLFKSRRYDVKQVEEFEDNTGYFVTAKQSIEADATHTIQVNAHSDIELAPIAAGPKDAGALAASDLGLTSEGSYEL